MEREAGSDRMPSETPVGGTEVTHLVLVLPAFRRNHVSRSRRKGLHG